MKRVALLLAMLALAGCAGAGKHAAAPSLPHALATRWAQRADGIAAASPCAAHRGATALRTDVILAVNRRKIPGPLLEPLTSKVNSLAARAPCSPVRREARALAAWLRARR